MAWSEQLSGLRARINELETLAVASRQKAKTDLERDVERAGDSAQAHARWLRKSAEAREGQISAAWDALQRSWNENVASLREEVDDRKAERDVKVARRRADRAGEDAAFAIDYAYAVLEAAEYAVVDAELAQVEAEDLAAANAPSWFDLDEEVA